ncbi:MAG: serine/threonine protein kinase, partial [Rivularia sp. ALOHA_DT_140]|nr:serine/threonine protein kinase [Rivularia sp. ALOHA_DT_140]
NHLRKNTDNDTTIIIHQEELPADTLLDYRYKITEGLSSGGFGRTYLAEDTKRPGNPICVVKQLRPSRSDEQFLTIARRLFDTEGRILERLGRKNQHIPQLLAYFEEGGQFYLIQEYIEGQPLDKEIIPGKPWEEAKVIHLLKEVLQVLDFVHSHQVIHRDVKPSNLMRRKSDERIVLIDFGTVKIIEEIQSENLALEQQENHIVTYSPGYAPTEQMGGKPQFNTDIFALGMVAIQALTGIHPNSYRRDNNSIVLVPNKSENEGLQIWRNQVQVSEKLADVIDRMVEYNSTDRYQSAAEVLKILESL